MERIFYHGTSAEKWKAAEKQGFLLHERATKDFPNMTPCTYLAVDQAEAENYGNIVLEVLYDPSLSPDKNNYMEGAWQLRVYEPIQMEKIKLCKGGE